jgi:hypothetical protein
MTERYDIERTITSLGIGEALVTVLSPKGVPTPLAATRLIPPDSRMAPLSEQELAQVVAGSQLQARYGTAIDRESAHEIITARLMAARQAAEAAAAQAGGTPAPAGGAGTATAGGGSPYGGMTRTQYEAQIRREARDAERERVRQQREAERARKAEERAARSAERQRQKTIETSIRTAGRVVTSRAGQSILRGVFDTIFGGKR